MKILSALILAIVFLTHASAAFAQCRSETIFLPDGRMMICTVCCFSTGHCTTNCV